MNSKYKAGDKVFVIDWGKHYSSFTKWVDNQKQKIFPWKTELPDYSGIDHHWEYKYKPKLTLKGVPFKNGERELVSKKPVYKDYKYEVLEVYQNPNYGELTFDAVKFYGAGHEKAKASNNDYDDTKFIYLLASTHTDNDWQKCHAQIGEEGLSLLTPQQFADKEFNALKTYHKKRWTPEIREIAQKEFPKELIKSVYDKNDRVLFGSATTKGKVHYDYIPGEFMSTGRDFILSVGVDYDGKGNDDLPEGSRMASFNELKKLFPDN